VINPNLISSFVNHEEMENNPNHDCFNCNGSGKVRKNRSENGKYIFGKITCDVCLGSGTKIWFSAIKRIQ